MAKSGSGDDGPEEGKERGRESGHASAIQPVWRTVPGTETEALQSSGVVETAKLLVRICYSRTLCSCVK